MEGGGQAGQVFRAGEGRGKPWGQRHWGEAVKVGKQRRWRSCVVQGQVSREPAEPMKGRKERCSMETLYHSLQ